MITKVVKTVIYTSPTTSSPNHRNQAKSKQPSWLNLEPKPSHTALILVDGRLALLRRVLRLGEEHTVVAGGLFGLADAAGL